MKFHETFMETKSGIVVVHLLFHIFIRFIFGVSHSLTWTYSECEISKNLQDIRSGELGMFTRPNHFLPDRKKMHLQMIFCFVYIDVLIGT